MKFLQFVWLVFAVVPLVLGSIATWSLLATSNSTWVFVVTVSAFLAGLLPTIYAALKLDDHLPICRRSATEFKNLQDHVRQAALIASKKPFSEFEVHFAKLIERMERASADSITPPDWFFARAQKKVKSGDYHYDRAALELHGEFAWLNFPAV